MQQKWILKEEEAAQREGGFLLPAVTLNKNGAHETTRTDPSREASARVGEERANNQSAEGWKSLVSQREREKLAHQSWGVKRSAGQSQCIGVSWVGGSSDSIKESEVWGALVSELAGPPGGVILVWGEKLL